MLPGQPPPRKSRGPVILIVLGALGMFVGLVLTVLGGVFIGTELVDTVKDGLDPERDLDLVVQVPGSGEVELESGTYDVVLLGNGLTVEVQGGPPSPGDSIGHHLERTAFAVPPLTVTSGGTDLELGEPGMPRLYKGPGGDLVSVYAFEATDDASYTLTVEGDAGAQVEQAGIVESSELNLSNEHVRRSLGGTLLLLVGIPLGTLGFLLLIGGVIWRLVGS
jgi:hypothetical protein